MARESMMAHICAMCKTRLYRIFIASDSIHNIFHNIYVKIIPNGIAIKIQNQ